MSNDHVKDKTLESEVLQALQQIVTNAREVHKNNNAIMQLLKDIKITLKSMIL